MSTFSSPNVVNSGQTFYIDQNNTKSYLGPPIQNLSGNIGYNNSGPGTGISIIGGYETVNVPGLGLLTVTYSNIQNNYTSYSPNSTDCCPSPIGGWGGFAVSPSTLYTYAIVYKVDSGYTNANYMYRYEYVSNGGAYVGEGGVFNDANKVALGDGWFYAWGTFTTAATTNWIGYAASFYYRYAPTNDKLSVAKVLITPGNYSGLHPIYWPDKLTTRANTNVFSNLVGTTSITANNLTYASNGLVSFNGTSGNLTTNTPITSTPALSNWTYEVWTSLTSWPTAVIPPNGSGISYRAGVLFGATYYAGAALYWYGNATGNGCTMYAFLRGNDAYRNTAGYTMSLNTMYQFVMVNNYTSNLIQFYVNGVFYASTPAATQEYNAGLIAGLNIGISLPQVDGGGTANYSYYPGIVNNCKIYNTALTANQIQQNYNALKERFLGYQTLNYIASSNVTLTNNNTQDVTMFKTADNNSWNGQAYSLTPFTAPCTIEFNKEAVFGDNGVSYAMIGWNTDPTTDASYSSIDHASYPFNKSAYHVYHNGSNVLASGIWDNNKKFYVVYDTDGFIRHYNGEKLLYSANYGTGQTVYVDSSFYSVDATYGGFKNVKVCNRSWNGLGYV